MLRFSRSETKAGASSKPRLADAAGLRAWLAGMAQPPNLSNLAEITEALEGLGAVGPGTGGAALTPDRKFAVADRVRPLLMQALSDRAGDEALNAIPVTDEYARAFWPAIEAASALRDVYAWLVSQLPSRERPADTRPAPGAPAAGPTVTQVDALHRALEVNAHVLLVIQRARWPVPVAWWERHCTLGQLVRDLDCQDVEVPEGHRVQPIRTCRGAFVLPILVALADPASKSAVEFDVLRMAALRWSLKVGYRIERRGETGEAPPRPVTNPGPTVLLGGFLLRFDTQSAVHSIDKRLALLADGRSPKEVGIGDALRATAARDLLTSMRQRWGAVSPQDIDAPDRNWRVASVPSRVAVCVTMPRRDARGATVASPLNGPTRSPDPYGTRRVEHNAITKPRTVVEGERIDQLLEHAEWWTLVAQTRDALRCVRKHGRPRLTLQRLVAMRFAGEDPHAPLLLGWVEALQSMIVAVDDRPTGHTDAHTVRIRLAPGMPIIVRASADEQELDFAFLLVPRMNDEILRSRGLPPTSFVPMSSDLDLRAQIEGREVRDAWDGVRATTREYGLVLPQSTFRMHRQIRAVRDGSLAMLRLEELMLRGADFDLVRFSVV